MTDGKPVIVFCVDRKGEYGGDNSTIVILGQTHDGTHLSRDVPSHAIYFMQNQTGMGVVTSNVVPRMLDIKGRGDVRYPSGLGAGVMQVSPYSNSIPEDERVEIPDRQTHIRPGNFGFV